MSSKWIALVVALAVVAGSAPAGAQAKQDVQAQPAPAAQGKATAAKPTSKSAKKLVNLNAASAKELKALPGGSDEEAARIIAGRPYNSKAMLVTNQIVDAGRYEEIKRLIVAGQPAKPAAKASAAGTK